MAIKQLTQEQVRTMSLAEKDRWWLENVWKGDMPQLTLRSGATGMILGFLLSITNLYVGAKTGWTLGVGVTSVILAFAAFKVMSSIGLADDFTLLENNAMQSIATAAGYMTAPLVSSLGAYMIVTDSILPGWKAFMWLISLGLLGVLFAFPLKKRFINDEQHPFPEGRAVGVVLDTLHGEDAKDGLFKAKLLAFFGVIAGLLKLLQSHAIMEWLQVDKLGMKKAYLGVPEFLDGWYYSLAGLVSWVPTNVRGIPLKELTVRPELDIAMIGAGGLMGIRTGVSLMIGAVLNYMIIAPAIIQRGDIYATVSGGDFASFGFRNITIWALWGGVAMMTTASLFSFMAKPQMILSAFSGLFKSESEQSEVQERMKKIELPMSLFVIGIPIVGAMTVLLAYWFFDVKIWLGVVAIPLVFVFTLIGVNSTALTSITPTGALGKLTQLTYGALDPGNIKTNLMTAGITGEVASNSSNLLMDIKPGYMLGAKPRHQAMGHVLGIIAGACASVPVFYWLFLQGKAGGNPNDLISAEYPFPAITIWKAVAEILTEGLDKLSMTAIWAVVIGGVAGIVLELIKIASKGKFPISAVGIGLAFVIPYTTCLAMFMGSFIFWVAEKVSTQKEGVINRVIVQNQEPISAGIIAGAALMGMAAIAVELFVLG